MTTRLLAVLLLATTTACATKGQGTMSSSAAHEPAASSAKLDPSWAPLAFLVGKWESTDGGATGGARGGFSLLPDLDGKVLVRRNVSESPQGRHEDLMVLYREGDGFRAFYVDNENHVIHYAVTTGDGNATFTSDAMPGHPRFRLTYSLNGDSKLGITFAIQPPGATDFKTYLQGTVVRR